MKSPTIQKAARSPFCQRTRKERKEKKDRRDRKIIYHDDLDYHNRGIPLNVKIEAFGILNVPMVEEEGKSDISGMVSRAIDEEGVSLDDGDIVVVTEKIVSKAEGRVVELADVSPSPEAERLAKETGKDPRLVELILGESNEVLRVGEGLIITETTSGLVCANAGIDQSNVLDGRAKLLPADPDKSAREIRNALEKRYGVGGIGVVIADSFGRPFRSGSVGVAIGASGIKALWDRRGEKDIYGRELAATRVAVADMLASTASLLMGEAGEKIAVVVIRGCDFRGEGNAADLLRERDEDIFR
jgi:coenzyme F420-0:L-glutamate ligase / coenzyme F420-1:gamma-L-glutamate ligase